MKQLFFIAIIFTSLNAQYSLQINNKGGARTNGEFNTFSVSIVNNAGKIVYSVERKLPFDVPYPGVKLDEKTGNLILLHSFDGFVETYNNAGKKIWEHNFYKEASPNYERTMHCVFGVSSLYFLTSDQYLPKAMLHKFSWSGAQQWNIELPNQMAHSLALSPDEKTVIASSYLSIENDVRRSAAFFSTEGKILGDAKILFRKAAFSADEKFVLLMSERDASLVSMESKNEIGRISKEDAKTIFTDCCWNGEKIILQEAIVEFRAPNGFVYVDPIFTAYTPVLQKISVEKLKGVVYTKSTLRAAGSSVEFQFDDKKQVLK